MEILAVIGNMIWLMLPAYLSNPAAAVTIAVTGSGKPIDFGKSYKGRRILGDGKTFRGLFSGIAFGVLIGIIQNLINICFFKESLPVFSYISIVTLPIGALLGDMIASFYKRRVGLSRGQSFPLMDQLDFVFGAWILTLLFANSWFRQYFTVDIMLATVILTPFLHLIVNIFGYKIGVSREPW